eukprot:1778777-Prymnesium_polylepis.1
MSRDHVRGVTWGAGVTHLARGVLEGHVLLSRRRHDLRGEGRSEGRLPHNQGQSGAIRGNRGQSGHAGDNQEHSRGNHGAIWRTSRMELRAARAILGHAPY